MKNKYFIKLAPKHVDTSWGPVLVCSALNDKKAVHAPNPFRVIDDLTGLTQCGDCGGAVPSDTYLKIDLLFKKGK